MFPNRPNTFTITDKVLTADMLNRLAENAIALYIIGCFIYDDEFHDTHHTRFCSFLNPFRESGSPLGPVNFRNFSQCPTNYYRAAGSIPARPTIPNFV